MKVPFTLDSKVFFMPKMTYKEQLAHPKWQRKRLEIFKRDDFACQYCLDTQTQLQVHHKYYDYQKMAWEYPNHAYITICCDCHKAITEHIDEYGNDSEFATLRLKNNGMYDRLIIYSNGIVRIPIENDINNVFLYENDAHKIVQFLINNWLKSDR